MRNRSDLLQRLNTSGIKPEKYNTNNAWGFGGSHGDHYPLPDGSHIRIGTATFRHAGTAPVTVFEHPKQNVRHTDEEGVNAAHEALDRHRLQ